MRFLAIETSCDETALSLIEQISSNNLRVLSDLVISQIDVHKKYGGVFPQMAKREHAKNLVPLLEQVLKESNEYLPLKDSTNQDKEWNWDKEKVELILEREPDLYNALSQLVDTIHKPRIDGIMVTYGPGLAPALWVGVNFARALSVIWDLPIIPVNHMEGHISSILFKEHYKDEDHALVDLSDVHFPLLALLISGGHTQLVLVKDWGDYKIIGETIDDAVGEAFDKVARMLGMEYPGGPKISRATLSGVKREDITFPRPMLHSHDYRFSFSGLKTAVRYFIDELKARDALDQQMIADISAEFQAAVTEVLLKKTLNAIEEFGVQGLVIAGGVAANDVIVNAFKEALTQYTIPLYIPLKKLSGDNSLMIASAGYLHYLRNEQNKKNSNRHDGDKKTAFTPQEEVKAVANLRLF